MRPAARWLACGVGAGGVGLVMRCLAAAASAPGQGATGEIAISVVNCGALWLAILTILAIAASRSRAAALAAGAAWAVISLGTYYGHVVPTLPHERLWFALGIPTVSACAAFLHGHRGTTQARAAGTAALLEPALLGAVGRWPSGAPSRGVLVAEVLVGAALVVSATRARTSRRVTERRTRGARRGAVR